MSKVHYTVEQVWALKPQFKEMVAHVFHLLLNVPDYNDVDFKQTFKVDGNDFEFLFKSTGILTLLGETKSLGDPKVVGATIFIGNRPSVFSVQLSDFENPTPVSESVLENMTNGFIATLVAGMTRDWYFNDGMHDRIQKYIDERDMSALIEHVDPGLYCHYDNRGFWLSYTNKEGDLLYEVKNYNALKAEDFRNTYKAQFERYLNDLIIVLLGAGVIWTETHWSKSLN